MALKLVTTFITITLKKHNLKQIKNDESNRIIIHCIFSIKYDK
jgi:hypothetical protein